MIPSIDGAQALSNFDDVMNQYHNFSRNHHPPTGLEKNLNLRTTYVYAILLNY